MDVPTIFITCLRVLAASRYDERNGHADRDDERQFSGPSCRHSIAIVTRCRKIATLDLAAAGGRPNWPDRLERDTERMAEFALPCSLRWSSRSLAISMQFVAQAYTQINDQVMDWLTRKTGDYARHYAAAERHRAEWPSRCSGKPTAKIRFAKHGRTIRSDARHHLDRKG